jgi:hypothetical protein
VVVEAEPDPDETVVVTTTPGPEATTSIAGAFDSVAFDVGPLAPRIAHSVVWTGEEMIVWGGRGSSTTAAFDDGAAFDPDASSWRAVASSPMPPSAYHFAVWTGEEMLVFAGMEAAAYKPGSDSWRDIAGPPLAIGGTEESWYRTAGVWTGNEYVVLASDQAFSYTPETDAWSILPSLGRGWTSSTLRWAEDTVYAFGIVARTTPEQPGAVLQGAMLRGSEWVEIPSLSLSTPGVTSDANPAQIAWVGDKFVAWSLDGPEFPAYTLIPGSDGWVAGSTTTIHPCEGAPPPLEIGNGVFISSCGHSVYDGAADSWTEVRTHGDGLGRDMVWTGKEVLFWGACCSQAPAWRYTPPG